MGKNKKKLFFFLFFVDDIDDDAFLKIAFDILKSLDFDLIIENCSIFGKK